MTTIYFIRHAESDLRHPDDTLRPLTAKGMKDRELATAYLADKAVDLVFSSPCQRAIDTIKPFADASGLPIHVIEDFRERKVAGERWIEDFDAFAKQQWDDFAYSLPGGESLAEVQARNVAALQRLLQLYGGQVLVVGSHGTALSTIIHYYDHTYGFADFQRIKKVMPWVVRFSFAHEDCTGIAMIDLFRPAAVTRRL